jgi:type IV pilus assembly protein PilV
MVAVVVICVGLLGIAKMESLSQSNMTTSRLRALAAFEAAGLAAAMHTNRDYWANTPANYTITVNPSAAPAITSSDAALQAQASADFAAGPAAANGATGLNACVGSAGGLAECTPVNLASYDVARWTASLQGLLPNPTAAISCPNVAGAAAPTSCTIQISWTERAVAMNTQEAAQQAAGNNGEFETPTYLLYVEP